METSINFMDACISGFSICVHFLGFLQYQMTHSPFIFNIHISILIFTSKSNILWSYILLNFISYFHSAAVKRALEGKKLCGSNGFLLIAKKYILIDFDYEHLTKLKWFVNFYVEFIFPSHTSKTVFCMYLFITL